MLDDEETRHAMKIRFKGMRKGDMNANNLLRKYETELTALKKFAYGFPGFVDSNKLPSGTPQIQHLRKPVVSQLWVANNQVSLFLLQCHLFFSHSDSQHSYLQGREGLNYDDPVAVSAEIPATWWLEHKSCKYILSVLVHKNNKDISTQPTKLPPGPTRKEVREKSRKTTETERANAKLTRPLEVVIDGSTRTVTLGDVERDAKMAQVDGMRSVIEKNRIDSIERQISVMERLEKVYVKRMGRETYESQLLHLVNQLPGMLATGANEGVEDGEEGVEEGVEGSEEGVEGAEGEME
jgi:hypothetical protein